MRKAEKLLSRICKQHDNNHGEKSQRNPKKFAHGKENDKQRKGRFIANSKAKT